MIGLMFLAGGLPPGGSLSRGLCSEGVSVQGYLGGLCERDTPPRTVKSERYASYWNAFLFQQSIYFGFTF